MKLAELNGLNNDQLREYLESSDYLIELIEQVGIEIVDTNEFVSSLVEDNPQDGAVKIAKYASQGLTFAHDFVRVDGPYYRNADEADSISELITDDEVNDYREYLASDDGAEELASL